MEDRLEISSNYSSGKMSVSGTTGLYLTTATGMNMPTENSKTIIAEHFSSIIKELGLDLSDPNLSDTPNRYAKALLEMCRGLVDTDGQIREVMKVAFPTDYDEMVVVRGIESVGICPHHFLPVLYDSVVGYVPNPKGLVVGLSKLPRIVEILSARPVLQEDLAVDISDTLGKYLNPLGVGVLLVGRHGCMQCRGVKMRDSDTVTTRLVGCFKEELKVKEEFLAYCKPVLELGF